MRSALRKIPAPGAACLWAASLLACSVSLESPEDEARKKLATLVPTTFERLEGRWVGDSTYTIFDTRATPLDGEVVLDVLLDSTASIRDPEEAVFPGAAAYRISLRGDSLVLIPGAGGGRPESLTVRLRFLGNWLELGRSSDQRAIHFHKLKGIDSVPRDSLLRAGVWLRKARRPAFDSLRLDALRRDFEYLRFSGDSMARDMRTNGLSEVAAGPVRPEGRRWAWTPGGGDRQIHLDLLHRDTLRFWTLADGRADSGFSLYVREQGPHRFDVDMTRYAGHLRMDTLREADAAVDAHYGRFFDLVLGRDHAVTTLTNMPDMPRFRAWGVDTGHLFLETPDGARHPFRVDTLPDSLLRITSLTTGPFPRPVTLTLTKVDGSAFAAHPLERFQNASYLRLRVRADSGAPEDTLDYFWNAASRRLTPEEHEIARIETVGTERDTLWAAWRLDPAQDPFGSSRPGFLFAFSGRNAALGRFTCRSRPDLDLVLRLRPTDAAWAGGLVQGGCRILVSEKAPADSVLLLDGEFWSRRRNVRLAAPHWAAP